MRSFQSFCDVRRSGSYLWQKITLNRSKFPMRVYEAATPTFTQHMLSSLKASNSNYHTLPFYMTHPASPANCWYGLIKTTAAARNHEVQLLTKEKQQDDRPKTLAVSGSTRTHGCSATSPPFCMAVRKRLNHIEMVGVRSLKLNSCVCFVFSFSFVLYLYFTIITKTKGCSAVPRSGPRDDMLSI